MLDLSSSPSPSLQDPTRRMACTDYALAKAMHIMLSRVRAGPSYTLEILDTC